MPAGQGGSSDRARDSESRHNASQTLFFSLLHYITVHCSRQESILPQRGLIFATRSDGPHKQVFKSIYMYYSRIV